MLKYTFTFSCSLIPGFDLEDFTAQTYGELKKDNPVPNNKIN